MGDTSIQWTDRTWNPVTGCSKVSQGCKHCYAERLFPRTYAGWCTCGHRLDAHKDSFGVVGSEFVQDCNAPDCECQQFTQRKFINVLTHPDRIEQPLHWKKPQKVFVNSMSDLFHEDVPFEFIDKVFAAMYLSKRHTYQILTKRPERMLEYVNQLTIQRCSEIASTIDGYLTDITLDQWPLPNVWLGVSVEDQATANERIPLLLKTLAAKLFVSYEPALGPVDFGRIEVNPPGSGGTVYLDTIAGRGLSVGGSWDYPSLDWIICGGESGHGARPFRLSWARLVVEQCANTKVACFVKQLGRMPTDFSWFQPDWPKTVTYRMDPVHGFVINLRDSHGGDWAEWPHPLKVRQFPEKGVPNVR